MPDVEQNFGSVEPERISRNSMWIFLGQAGTALVSLITIFFLPRYLGPENFGIYSLAFIVAGLFIPLSDMGVNLHLTRIVAARPQLLPAELSRTLSIRVILAAVFWAIMIITGFILAYDGDQIFYIALAGISMIIASIGQTYIMAIRALRRMKYESLSIFYSMISRLFLILAMIAARLGIMFFIIAHFAGSLIYLFLPRRYLKSLSGRLQFRFDLSELSSRLKSSLSFGITAVFVTIYFKIGSIMISKMVGTAEVGLYNAAYNIISASMMFSAPLVVSIFSVLPSVYEKEKTDADLIFNDGFLFSMLIGIPFGFGVFLMAGPIVDLAYGAEFHNSTSMLAIMSGTIPLLFATNLVGNSIGAVGFQKQVAVVAGVNMVFNIVMNFILIPRYGGRGAAVVTLSTEFLGFCLLLLLSRKVFRLTVSIKVIGMVLICLVCAYVFLLIRDSLGAWISAAVFAAIYALLVLSVRIVSVAKIKGIILPSR
jgi:O-antigen/teichoic acid export membrane protein